MFIKVSFTSSEYGNTAGLVIEKSKLDKMTVGDISRLFPYSESMKMKKLQISPPYNTFTEAFNHQF